MCPCQGITLQSSKAVNNAKRLGWPLTEVGEALYLTQAPGGYPFYLVDKEQPSSGERHMSYLCLLSKERDRSVWGLHVLPMSAWVPS